MSNDSPEVKVHQAPDGLSELDNPLPRWWLYLFYFTVVFAVGYGAVYPLYPGWNGLWNWSSAQQYTASLPPEVAQAQAVPDLKQLAQDPQKVANGKAVFKKYCAACHMEDGKGKVGPNLTDAEWKYGGTDADILKSIRKGRPGGMPPWGKALKGDELNEVGAFVRSLGEQK